MSLAASAKVLATTYGSQLRKLLMLILADYADEAGTSYPSIETLARRAECSTRAAQENLRTLEAEGHLTITQNAGRNGTNLYHIRFPKPHAPPQQMHPAADAPPQMTAAQTAPGGADDRRPSAPEPSGTVRNHQEGGKDTPPPADPAIADEAQAAEDDRILHDLNRAYPNALPHLSRAEDRHFRENLPTLRQLTPEDFLALRAWNCAPAGVRGRALWPRSRAEFLEKTGEATEHIRTFWKLHGRAWWQRTGHRLHQPKPPPATSLTPPDDLVTDPTETRRLLGLQP